MSHLRLRLVVPAALSLLLGACGGGDGANTAGTAAPAAPAPSSAPAPAPAASAEEQVLNIYNWSDYIAPDTVANFEKETGIKVRYDVFDSNEVLEAKLLAGNTGYDIVVPSANFVARQIKAGIFQRLNRNKLANYKNLDPEIMKALAGYDPDNAYVLPYLWGTDGIGYNVAKIKERMNDAPITSWDMLFKPEIVARFKDCGVSMLDTPSEVVPLMLRYLKLPTDSQTAEDLAKVEAALMQVRPHVKYFHSSQYLNDLANGELCLVMGWSGDIFQARDRAREAKNGNDIAYVIPKEGTLMWFDTMAIPKDAPHVENAYKFLDYILRGDVAASISNEVKYANANQAATAKMDPEVVHDPAVYPDEATRATLFPNVVNPPDYDRLVTRAWTRIKTNQ
ncbi:MAG: polyamine ABC transporter substrate-binding protein [Proteobacteria bacterium]|nr:polyamine ABC transporter substrate-binding protein [Pseudomonadota bacterium]